jgi:hypothetical protein
MQADGPACHPIISDAEGGRLAALLAGGEAKPSLPRPAYLPGAESNG